VSLSKVKEAQKGSAHFSLLRMEHTWNFLTDGRKLNIKKTIWSDFRGCFPQEEQRSLRIFLI
jgi:hypothetical protein